MKHLSLICILFGLLLQNFSKSLIVMQFKVNQTYIAKELCVNRDKPQMHCNGHCHLKKELDKDTQPEKNNNNGKDKYEVMFVDPIQSFSISSPDNQLSFISYYKAPRLSKRSSSIFHPPQLVVA
ncbi:hypothetical protein [Chitinophaga sp. 212800010-3]|uniref:hypothetical protein n=1 Tax=unclassified Chitinophaga TaxID=2619133 RepID=UPI002DEAB5CC|nr:Secreted protein [Chitinophaga sp. 212800010-3]